tara:strand:+ start:488 stop:670 length:183 start_codon:yes stop_codon:yes gene_type:complete
MSEEYKIHWRTLDHIKSLAKDIEEERGICEDCCKKTLNRFIDKLNELEGFDDDDDLNNWL